MDGLFLWLGLFQADDAIPFFPFAAFFEQLDALKTLKDGSVFSSCTTGSFKGIVLRHNSNWVLKAGKLISFRPAFKEFFNKISLPPSFGSLRRRPMRRPRPTEASRRDGFPESIFAKMGVVDR